MSTALRGALLAFGLAASLVACSSPTHSVTFRAPAGWIATPSLFGFQAWRTSDRRQVLVLLRFPMVVDPNRALQQSNVQQLRAEHRRQITICGKQRALFISGIGTGRRGPQHTDIVMTTVGGQTYVAVYARDLGVAPNADAETAIRSLCPKTQS